ncbi:hypothetical protein ACSCBZ_09955 [Streptomyces niveiscabiei]|uniref:Secreted protein n=1 Tax=Streptomyces niveiscabiei TaxID=164115 RepID=A0ABW9I4U5_9ACTN|nr:MULTISPECIES: hypothetical protein [Streptomyces]QZZ31132.1 hypothetical protein A7X85_37265 [Streptomyces sp. ST1015]
MRSLPLPLALAARLSPVVVLACAGWALSSSPASPEDTAAQGDGTRQTRSETDGAPSSPAATKAYAAAPAPCGSVSAKTVTALVPGAKTAGKEIPSTDTKVRRTCSWNALKGFDYRWLDVSFEIMDTEDAALKSYKARVGEKSGGGPVPGLGQEAYSVVNLTTEDKQQTREGVVFARVSNAIVIVTYNGSDFETKKAPDTSTINTGAIKAAKEAMGALQGGTTG